jgi:signal peptide peptidase SppA
MAAKAVKPVIASFGDVAASGGYYAAAAADVIFSNPLTITGSIGVISGWPVIKRLLQKVDVTSDSIEPTPNAAWRHMELGLPESEMEKLRKHTDEMYESFKKVVSIGRKMSMEDVEDIAQGQVFTGSQARELGLVDALGGLSDAIEWASLPQTLRENPDDITTYLKYLDEDGRKMFEEVSEAGDSWQKAVRDTIIALTDISDPDPEEIRKLVQRRTVQVKQNVSTIVIPHINPAGEALSAALATAFQTDDERSPVPIDLPVIGSGESSFNTYFSGRVIIGALVGIALSNNIPLWQFPAFCFWYAAQASGNIGKEGMVGGFLNGWFGKLLKEQSVFQATERPAHVFAGRKTAWDVRMEMPPFQIFF